MLWDFFLVTLKIGTLAFGGGYAMITPLHYELVAHHGWLTEAEFGSAVAIGQITPGPLMIMVAFMGYKIAGFPGAALGTIGLFLPSALFVLAVASSYLRLKDLPQIQGAMRGINLAVIGLLAAVAINLARNAIAVPLDAVIGVAAFFAVTSFKCDPILMILAASAVALIRFLAIGV